MLCQGRGRGDVPVTKKIQKAGPKVSPSSEVPREDEPLEVGQWYWVTDRGDRWLGCAVHIGSNYVEIHGVFRQETRVHLDEFDDHCVLEPNPDAHIDEQIRTHQSEVNRLMGRVKELTARLGVAPSPELPSGGETQALAKVEAGRDFKSYSKDLVKAKEKTLPDLFRDIERENSAMAAWMKSRVIPLRARAESMKEVISRIEDRIFSVELYAGLVEDVERIRDGDPAKIGEKVHLLQRRHYMDEECLARYKTGGMEFKHIRDFDRWMCDSENLDRILPFPRCVVAFRVRRNQKERAGASIADFIRIIEEMALDERTFLYIRNGGQVYRLGTKLDFGPKLFPDFDHSKLDGQKLWVQKNYPTWKIITENEYLGLQEEHERDVKEWEEQNAAYEAAIKSPEAIRRAKEKKMRKPDASCVDVSWPGSRPLGFEYFEKYFPYTPESVYYDDVTKQIEDDIKEHNRVALVLQGLLDRSPVFHPHPPWQIWTGDGFRQALELIYDEDRALPAGKAPDFDAYRKKLNESLKAGCVTIGQQRAWRRHEGRKEAERQAALGYGRSHHFEFYSPPGNPGPGDLARVYKMGGGSCTFAWHRERQGRDENGNWGGKLRTTFTCEVDVLMNVDAYKPGDFRIFFDDPRTRADYLKWAPFLLEAEEYHAGNREVLDPAPPGTAKKSSWEGQRKYAQRKLRKQLMGKGVRLVRDVKMRSGTVYSKGTLWRVTSGSGSDFGVTGMNEDGTLNYERAINNLDKFDFEVDPSAPEAPVEPSEEEDE